MNGPTLIAAFAIGVMVLGACAGEDRLGDPTMANESPDDAPKATTLATFGGGCFWCTEAVLEAVDGVLSVTSGYAGGSVDDPTYEAVCAGTTGHAEVVQVEFDPSRVSYEALLRIFFGTHDPTTLNRQGADRGTQYRSIVLHHDDAQKALAEKVRAELDASEDLGGPIVTEIVPLGRFYPAGADHQDYFRRNPSQAYCQVVIRPKMSKFRSAFSEYLDK